MQLSLNQIREAAVRNRSEAKLAGIEAEYVDIVAAVMAVLELTGLRDPNMAKTEDARSILSLPETFAEWATNFNLSTHYDRFLAIMVWLFERGVTTVTTAEILEMYDKARWKRPANAADVFSKGAQRIYFAEVTEPNDGEIGLKSWRLTRTGFRHLSDLRYLTEGSPNE